MKHLDYYPQQCDGHREEPSAAAITVIDRDREFDQTAKSETPGHVSPAILEFQIIELKDKLAAEQKLRLETQADLDEACRYLAKYAIKTGELTAAFADFETRIKSASDKPDFPRAA